MDMNKLRAKFAKGLATHCKRTKESVSSGAPTKRQERLSDHPSIINVLYGERLSKPTPGRTYITHLSKRLAQTPAVKRESTMGRLPWETPTGRKWLGVMKKRSRTTDDGLDYTRS